MNQRVRFVVWIAMAMMLVVATARVDAAPEGTLTVAVATFGNERWLPHLYPGAEDVVLKPWGENLLTRDAKTGELAPMLAERWKVADGGRTWTFYLRKGVQFHGGRGEVTAEDVRFTFASIAREGSASSLAPSSAPSRAWRSRIPTRSPCVSRSRRWRSATR